MIKKKMMSVAAKRRGRYSTETVGEIETRPFGNDSVATAGLLPWLTKAVTTTHRALLGEHVAYPPEARQCDKVMGNPWKQALRTDFFWCNALKEQLRNPAKSRTSEGSREEN